MTKFKERITDVQIELWYSRTPVGKVIFLAIWPLAILAVVLITASDAYQQYWREAIECALDEVGKQDLLTSEEYDKVAITLMRSHEMHGMAFGHDCIPNPMEVTVKTLELKLKQSKRETERTTTEFKENIAMRHRLDPDTELHRITLEGDGHAIIY